MTVHQIPSQVRPAPTAQADWPQPVSMETLAVMLQVAADTLRALQANDKASGTREHGELEYNSWLRLLR